MSTAEDRMFRVGQALGSLHQNQAKVAAFRDYASTAPNRDEYNHYMRRSLKWKAKGIVEHDRILNTGYPTKAPKQNG